MQHIALRFPPILVARIDRLQRAIEEDAQLAALGATGRSAAIRLAVERGLRVLEVEYELLGDAGGDSRGIIWKGDK